MSNSFLPKKAPNVFNQETLERMLVLLRQPFSIAVLASLGLHGVLWAALPNILAETAKEADTKQRVRTVELSPAEQSQLPTFGINQIAPTLTPTKPVPPATSGDKLPDPYKLPDPNKLYSYPLDTIPVFPPPNIYPNDFSSLFPKSPPEPKKEPPKQSTPGKTKVPPTPPPPNPQPSEPAQPTNSGGKDGKVDEPARSEGPSPQQRIAALQAEQRQLQALYTFNGSITDEGERLGKIFAPNFEAFDRVIAEKAAGNYDNDSYLKNPKRVDIPFPKEACLVMKEPFLKQAKHASVAAYFNADGKLADKPQFLLTSGFNGLDQLAFNYVNGTTWEKTAKPHLVRFEFIFDPKMVCPNLSRAT